MVEREGASSTSIVERLAGKQHPADRRDGLPRAGRVRTPAGRLRRHQVTLLVRSRTGQSSRDRVEYLFRKDSFDGLRERVGADGLIALLDERVSVLDADFSKAVPDIPAGIDVAMHSAATVSFDPPIDEGFMTNLQGAMNLYRGVIDSGSKPALVHVSTAYVAGVQKGVIPEGPLDHKVDYHLELELALQARHDVEAQSRRPELLNRFMDKARDEHSRAGPTTVAEDAEDRRKQWVTKRLVEYGRSRARSLGWPDVYTFTKAMGERAVEEMAAQERLPLSIVRPSIIESALLHPFPGLDRRLQDGRPHHPRVRPGADPGVPRHPRGHRRPHPGGLRGERPARRGGHPAGARARPTTSTSARARGTRCASTSCTSGSASTSSSTRCPSAAAASTRCRTGTSPGTLRVEKMLRRAERLTEVAEQIVTHLPKSKAMRDAVTRLDRDKARVEFIQRYSDLYGLYTETEVVYTDDRTLALFESLSEQDKASFPFDAAMVDWKYYLKDVHSPAVTQSLRELSTRDRQRPQVQIREREHPVVAVFDMEGTIITSNVVESYVWARMADLEPEDWPRELLSVFGRIPGYLQIDRRDRGEFLRTFFRRFEGASVEGIDRLVQHHVGEFMFQKASAAAIRRVRAHRAAGHRTILITAAAEPFVRPLAPLFDIVIGAELQARDGRYTGFMSSPPLVGEARAAWLKRYANQEGVDLKHSYAYADSLQRPPPAAGGREPRGRVP